MKPEPVELPYCPTCGAIGPQPNFTGFRRAVAYFCSGRGAQRSRTKMQLIPYVPKLDADGKIAVVNESEES